MSKFAGFQSVKLQKPQRSEFDLSHQKRLTMRMGLLTPVLCTEAVPGDTFRGNTEMLVRLAPLLAPIYDSIQVFVHVFFVPNRLLWEDWEEFITGGRLGVGVDPEEAPVPPYCDLGDTLDEDAGFFGKSSLADYLGCPLFLTLGEILGPADFDGCKIDVMPFIAYQLINYEYYRDRNFVPDNDYFPFASGLVDPEVFPWLYYMNTRSYMHDYFTSALPFTQRGEEVLMPLAGTGSVNYSAVSTLHDVAGDPYTPASPEGLQVYSDSTLGLEPLSSGNLQLHNIDNVLLDASSVSINDFRSAYALQVWLERNAVGGSRYTESTRAHFGVTPQDSRLQRPEFIGGGRIPVKISEVVSTAYSLNETENVVPQANMAGHGISYGNMNTFSYFCPEHGFIIAIASIMNPPSYHQGLPRMFYHRRSFLDYVWPTFAKLGEQAVDKVELYANPTNLTETDGEFPLFGYQSRYADWKFIANSNHGDFHDTLMFWTLTRHFENSPTLGNAFVLFEDSTQDRIFAVQDTDNFWIYVHNRLSVRRALPYFGTPNTLGFS